MLLLLFFSYGFFRLPIAIRFVVVIWCGYKWITFYEICKYKNAVKNRRRRGKYISMYEKAWRFEIYVIFMISTHTLIPAYTITMLMYDTLEKWTKRASHFFLESKTYRENMKKRRKNGFFFLSLLSSDTIQGYTVYLKWISIDRNWTRKRKKVHTCSNFENVQYNVFFYFVLFCVELFAITKRLNYQPNETNRTLSQ